jgi:hypothetical protein
METSREQDVWSDQNAWERDSARSASFNAHYGTRDRHLTNAGLQVDRWHSRAHRWHTSIEVRSQCESPVLTPTRLAIVMPRVLAGAWWLRTSWLRWGVPHSCVAARRLRNLKPRFPSVNLFARNLNHAQPTTPAPLSATLPAAATR